jgi:hypothetical protein
VPTPPFSVTLMMEALCSSILHSSRVKTSNLTCRLHYKDWCANNLERNHRYFETSTKGANTIRGGGGIASECGNTLQITAVVKKVNCSDLFT